MKPSKEFGSERMAQNSKEQQVKKVLFIQDALYGGGVEKITTDIARKFVSAGFDVSYALLDSTDIRMHLPEGVRQINLDVNSYFMRGNLWRSKNKKLSDEKKKKVEKTICDTAPDLLLIGHYRSLWLADFIDHPNAWYWIHGSIIEIDRKATTNLFRFLHEIRRHYIRIKIFRRLFSGKKIVVVNEGLKKNYNRVIPDSIIKVIHNGVDRKCLEHRAGYQAEKKWDLVFVGRLAKEKQPDFALRAFADSGLQGKMAFVGDGKMLEELKDLAKALGVSGRVDFVGWEENTASYISRSKALVLSSITEGSPLVIAEAVVLGVPVVAFDCSEGVRYQLDSGELQRGLVPPQDLEELSRRVFQIVDQPYKINEEDKARLTIDRMFGEFLELL